MFNCDSRVPNGTYHHINATVIAITPEHSFGICSKLLHITFGEQKKMPKLKKLRCKVRRNAVAREEAEHFCPRETNTEKKKNCTNSKCVDIVKRSGSRKRKAKGSVSQQVSGANLHRVREGSAGSEEVRSA